mgnify:CR=1 FL=1
MNTQLILTVIALGVIYELSKFVFKVGTVLFFQAEHRNALKENRLSIKDKIKIAEVSKKLNKNAKSKK